MKGGELALMDVFSFFLCQPSHNDKYSNQEMIQVMNELAKARKQLKGTFLLVQRNSTSSAVQTCSVSGCKNSRISVMSVMFEW